MAAGCWNALQCSTASVLPGCRTWNHWRNQPQYTKFLPDLIKKAKGLSSSVYSEESLKKVQEAVDALNAIIASTSQDKGAA